MRNEMPRTREEVVGFIEGQLHAFSQGINADLEIATDRIGTPPSGQKKEGRRFINEVLKENGLSGCLLGFTARSRNNLVGVPVKGVSGDRETTPVVGLYLPAAIDAKLVGEAQSESQEAVIGEVNKRVRDATAAIYREDDERDRKVTMRGSIVVVTSDQVDKWQETGMHPDVKVSRQSSFTQADTRRMSERNRTFFSDEYLPVALEQLWTLAQAGLRPAHLINPQEPVAKIGDKYLSVRVTSFVNPSYAKLEKPMRARDHDLCQALNMAEIERMDPEEVKNAVTLPICGESTIDNYRGGVGASVREIKIGDPRGEVNHILTQGNTAKLIAEAIHLGVIPESIYTHPDRLLDFVVHVDLQKIVSERMGELTAVPMGDLYETFAVGLQRGIEAVNSLENVVTMQKACHRGNEMGGYHPDMRNHSWTRFLTAVDMGTDPIPLDRTAFEKWKEERREMITSDQYNNRAGENSDWMTRIFEGRALVSALGGRPYVEPTVQRLLYRVTVNRTRKYIEEETRMRTADFKDQLEAVSGVTGASMGQVPDVVKIYQDMEAVRADIRQSLFVESTGATANKVLASRSLPPIERKGHTKNDH